MQLKIVSKEDAHRMIDEAPGNVVKILTYDNRIGISNIGITIKKRKGKKLIDKSKSIVLIDSNPIQMLNLHKNRLSDLKNYKREEIIKSIIFSK